MSYHVERNQVASLFGTLVLLSLALTRAVPLTVASSSTGIPLPPTSDAQACFPNINGALGQVPALSSDEKARLLQVAESSSQYKAFVQAAGGTASLVTPGPGIEYGTSPECAGITIEAYTFGFVSGAKKISIAVDPSSMSVLRTLTVPAVRHGVALNSIV